MPGAIGWRKAELGTGIACSVDKLSGKGPAEKAGERIDQAAKELQKK